MQSSQLKKKVVEEMMCKSFPFAKLNPDTAFYPQNLPVLSFQMITGNRTGKMTQFQWK